MRTSNTVTKNTQVANTTFIPYTTLDFSKIDEQAKNFADVVEKNLKKLTQILLKYESYEVVKDEIARTLDLLRNLKENRKYFHLRVGAVTSFLPRNQPLYAFTCFVLVPSLMASEVHFRIPNSMRNFFGEMLTLLNISKLFPNIFISSKTRIEFLKDRSILLINPETKESRPATDAVIFTGIPAHADQLRTVFDKRTLFIANGAGHNPVVISKDADISKAVEAVLTLQFYNQGQDCAAPNAILVHKDAMQKLLRVLRASIRNIKIGAYKDRSCRIGPISDPKDLVRIENFLIENREWLDPSTKGIIRASDAIVEPSIICKPLALGGNFSEIFAPIIFIQEYINDAELKYYFENQHYTQNAMYITLYGTSKYIKNIIGKSIKGKKLHNDASLIHNTHLHAPGIERGTQPYGGKGYGASSISINGKIIPMATLPQRDIYERIARPILLEKSLEVYKTKLRLFTKIETKDVEKILRLKSLKSYKQDKVTKIDNNVYFDLHSIHTQGSRYIKIEEHNLYHLLGKPNVEYIAQMGTQDITLINALKTLLRRKSTTSLGEFESLLYAIAKEPNASESENKMRQQYFFESIYKLLFGTESGPRLAPFLFEVEESRISRLLDLQINS